MVPSLKFKYFSVESEQDRQIKISVPCLFNSDERASILQTILLKRNAVKEVLINSANNAVKIKFNSEELIKSDLFDLLDNILANFSQKPREKIKGTGRQCPRCGKVEKEVVFHVEGMSCASCALYLEMTLSRNEKVSSVSIDYSSKKGFVSGCLGLDDVLDIVEAHGYKAHSIEEG